MTGAGRLLLLVGCMAVYASRLFAAEPGPVDDEFTNMDWRYWCDCRIAADAHKRQYLTEGGRSFLRVMVDKSDLGGNRCRKEELAACEQKAPPALSRAP